MNQAKKLQNPLLNNIGDGTLLQVIPGTTGTRPKAGGAHERSIHFFLAVVSLTADGDLL